MKKIKLLKRKRINSVLSIIFDFSLTIIEAPMGFGKTTAVRNFFESSKILPFWITLNNSGESASSFWKKFTTEIGKIDENIAVKLKNLGFPVDIPQIYNILSVLDGIDYKERTTIVIDDFHNSPDIIINKMILLIAAERLDNLHIVLITRDTTNIDFTELLFKGMCQVISQQQLKFTVPEVYDYCQIMYDNISDSDITKIKEYTDGWISLIYIILLGLEKGIPIGMSNSIDDLIQNAMFNSYDEYLRNFLLKLSIMNFFTAKQALFVTQEEKTYVILKKLQMENTFIFYDEITKTYKIHNVLLDFLRNKQHFAQEELKMLYRRLGEWYLERKELITAYGYLNSAYAFERILSILNEPANIQNELTEFEGSFEMFNKLPQELLNKYPFAYLQHIMLSIIKGSETTIEDCTIKLDLFKKTFESIDNIDESYRTRIIAESLIIKKFTMFNNLHLSTSLNDEIISLLDGRQSYIMLRENEFTFGSPHLLYIYFREQGTFKSIMQTSSEANVAYASFTNGCGTGSEHLALAEYALETGDWETAKLYSLKAIYKARTKEQTSVIICATFNLIRLYIILNKTSEGIEMLKQLEKDVFEVFNPIYNTTIDMCKGYIQACLGQPEKIPYWLQTGDMTKADFFYQGIAFNYIVYGKAVMISNRFIELEMLSETFNEHFSIFSNQLGFIHNNIFEAVAKYNLYGMEQGSTALSNALSKGQLDNIVMPFAENAPYIIDMLKIISNRNSNNEYIKKVLSYAIIYNESLKNSNSVKVKLSQREIEVLSFTAEGLSREEIGTRLFISKATVKTHLQNIYQKLNVNGKVSAIKTAQINGII